MFEVMMSDYTFLSVSIQRRLISILSVFNFSRRDGFAAISNFQFFILLVLAESLSAFLRTLPERVSACERVPIKRRIFQ